MASLSDTETASQELDQKMAHDQGGAGAGGVQGAFEQARLNALHRYDVLDTPEEEAFDRLVHLARELFGTPVAEVTFIDEARQWRKARSPQGPRETPREWSFCTQAIQSDDVMVVLDAASDPRVSDNPYVTGDAHIRFYAGAPLRTPDGHRLGAVCIVASEPRDRFDEGERAKLRALADIAMSELELRRHQRRDLQLRRQAENERDHAENLLRLFAEAVPGVVYAKDRSGRMLVANRGTTELIGKPPADYLGRTDAEFLDDTAQAAVVMTADARIMASGVAEQLEEVVNYPDGRRAVWFSTKAPLRNDAGEVTGLIGASVDITARKEVEAKLLESETRLRELNESLERRVEEALADRAKVEEQLRQAQKMEAVGQLTGGIAHDFNNMLAVVIGSLDLLARQKGAEDPRSRRYIDAATQGARRAALLTQRLLAFSRQQPLRPQPTDINKLVAGMSDLLRGSLGGEVRLETVLAGGLWRTDVDQNQLENVVLNLAVNARDAMPGGGRLTIETQNARLDARYAAAHLGVPAGQYVLIAVTDTGAGMPPEVAHKAFDPFFTTKEVGKGTGLGLSQVYGFVKQSGGHVKIYSELGQGTTVKVYLPRLLATGSEAVEDAEAAAVALDGRETVLVVEDESAVRAMSVDALEALGYRVLHADDAPAALRVLDAHPEVQLLFTDVVMPEVNGRKLAEEAVRCRPDLRVLFTTGYTQNAVVHNGVLDPGVELIGKPFTIEELGNKVCEVLDAVEASSD